MKSQGVATLHAAPPSDLQTRAKNLEKRAEGWGPACYGGLQPGRQPGAALPTGVPATRGRRRAPGDELPRREQARGVEERAAALQSGNYSRAGGGRKGDGDGTAFSAALEGSGEFGSRAVAAAQAAPGTRLCQK